MQEYVKMAIGKCGIMEFQLRIPDMLFNTWKEYYYSNIRLYKYKVLRCMVVKVYDG